MLSFYVLWTRYFCILSASLASVYYVCVSASVHYACLSVCILCLVSLRLYIMSGSASVYYVRLHMSRLCPHLCSAFCAALVPLEPHRHHHHHVSPSPPPLWRVQVQPVQRSSKFLPIPLRSEEVSEKPYPVKKVRLGATPLL